MKDFSRKGIPNQLYVNEHRMPEKHALKMNKKKWAKIGSGILVR